MNAWAYIALFAVGVIAGMIIEWYIVRDRIMNKTVEIRRNKQKGGPGNSQDIDLEFNESETSQLNNKQSRKEKRAAKQAERKLNKSIKNGGTNV